MSVARPKKCRCVRSYPRSDYFKPRGIPLVRLEEVSISADGIEALRLADLEGLYHAEAAAKMKVSRATFGRILAEVHRRVADALVNGKALAMEKTIHPQEVTDEGMFCGRER